MEPRRLVLAATLRCCGEGPAAGGGRRKDGGLERQAADEAAELRGQRAPGVASHG
jgi:hypothetical protein